MLVPGSTPNMIFSFCKFFRSLRCIHVSSKNKQIKKIINVLLKISISAGSIAYLVYLLGYKKADLVSQIKLFFTAHDISLPILLLIIVLMLFNWGSEVYKWKLLANHMFPISNQLAIKSTLAGVAASVFTPYRVGGYFGKVALFKYRYRAKGIVLQMYNAMAMFIVNFFFGLLFLGLLGWGSDNEVIGLGSQTIGILGLIGALIVLVFWFLYVYVNFIAGLFEKLPFTKKWSKYWDMLSEKGYKKTASKILGISILRYLGITYQYVLAYQLFGIEMDWWSAYFASGALFFLFQFVPVFNAVELGLTRTAMFTVILTSFGIVNEITPQLTLAITSASFLIWLINLAVPSILGSVFLGQVKVLKEK